MVNGCAGVTDRWSVRGLANVTVTDSGLIDCATGLELPLITGPIVNLCPETTIPLGTDAGLAEYQWLFEGAVIPGATGPVYEATLSGDYSVRVGDGSSRRRLRR